MCLLQKLVAENIRLARRRLGFTQKHLSGLTRLSLSSIREIETGRRFPTANSFDRIADALGLKPYKLFYDSQQMELYDKYERIANYSRELTAKINSVLDDTTEKYLKAGGVI